MQTLVSKIIRRLSMPIMALLVAAPALGQTGTSSPTPMLSAGTPATWLFVFKLNAAIFPSDASAPRDCAFGGAPQPYPAFGQRFVWASDASAPLQDGTGLAGTSANDPLGATFGQIYNGGFHFVVWNDQPVPSRNKKAADAPGYPTGPQTGLSSAADDPPAHAAPG